MWRERGRQEGSPTHPLSCVPKGMWLYRGTRCQGEGFRVPAIPPSAHSSSLPGLRLSPAYSVPVTGLLIVLRTCPVQSFLLSGLCTGTSFLLVLEQGTSHLKYNPSERPFLVLLAKVAPHHHFLYHSHLFSSFLPYLKLQLRFLFICYPSSLLCYRAV